MVKPTRLLVFGVQVWCLIVWGLCVEVDATDAVAYVGTDTCAECHPEQAERFQAFSKKVQGDLVETEAAAQSTRLANTINNAIFDALSTGENDDVRAQFVRLNQKLPGVNIYVYDFRGVVSFSTDHSAVGSPMNRLLSESEAAVSLKQMLNDHQPPPGITVDLSGAPHNVEHLPIFN